jgi:hypothetical protein
MLRREALVAWIRVRREALAARIRTRVPPAVLEKSVAAWHAARRRPETVLAAALMFGVVVMILHWR